jgi:hypothetical protein
MPLAMFVTMFIFSFITGTGRGFAGIDTARAGRYVYLQAVLALPLLAVAAQAVGRRWPKLVPVLVVLFLVPIPFNLAPFDDYEFGKGYFERRRYILTTAVRMPFAHAVPRSVRPVPDAYDGDKLNMGFLLDAVESGKLEPSETPLKPVLINEFRVRLGFSQSHPSPGQFPGPCSTTEGHYDIAPAKGDSFIILQPMTVTTIDRVNGRPTSPHVPFSPRPNGSKFTAELPNLRLRIHPKGLEKSVTVCPYG